MFGSTVVSGGAIRMLVSDFGAEHNRASNPVVPGDAMFLVSCFETRSLAPHIIEILVAEANEVVPSELPVRVVNDRPLGGKASKISIIPAIRPIGIRLEERRCIRIIYIRGMSLILIPG